MTGIIHAHTGVAQGSTDPDGGDQDHPRPHGRGGAEGRAPPAVRGSSTPTRAWHPSRTFGCGCLGIIHAHTGVAVRGWRLRRSCRDHPRPHGRGRLPQYPFGAAEGSSTPTRAWLTRDVDANALDGIIHAHTGVAFRGVVASGGRRDHPRPHGRGSAFADSRPVTVGSSTPTRAWPSTL